MGDCYLCKYIAPFPNIFVYKFIYAWFMFGNIMIAYAFRITRSYLNCVIEEGCQKLVII